MKEITFVLTLDETKKIFEALGKEPFSEVYELIGKLNDQVNQAAANNSNENGAANNGKDIE